MRTFPLLSSILCHGQCPDLHLSSTLPSIILVYRHRSLAQKCIQTKSDLNHNNISLKKTQNSSHIPLSPSPSVALSPVSPVPPTSPPPASPIASYSSIYASFLSP